MENNLDDILVDDQEKQEKQDKPKRKILIGVASTLLIIVVILVLYFSFFKKEKPTGLEVTHAELEKFVNPNSSQMPKSKEDEEFDKLIAEIKAKDQKNPQNQISADDQETDVKETQSVQDHQASSLQALQKTSQYKQEGSKQEELKSDKSKKEIHQKEMSTIQKSSQKSQEKQEEKKIKDAQKKRIVSQQETARTEKKSPSQKEQKSQTKSAIKTFNSLGGAIPRGFYLQVGVFGSKPNSNFMSKLSTFPYQVEKIDQGGKVVNRYLVGPFKTKAQAQGKIDLITQKIAKPMIIEVR